MVFYALFAVLDGLYDGTIPLEVTSNPRLTGFMPVPKERRCIMGDAMMTGISFKRDFEKIVKFSQTIPQTLTHIVEVLLS